MGLFGNKLELKKEFFEPCLSMNKIEVSNFRERQGLKVKIENSNKKILVTSSVGCLLRNIETLDCFWDNGERGYNITIRDFKNVELIDFMNKNFTKIGQGWILNDGSKVTLKITENNRLLGFDVGKIGHYEY